MPDDKQLTVRQTNLELIRSFDDLMKMATMLVKSGFLPVAIKTPEAAAATILLSREVGFSPMAGFNLINVIQGKPTVAPQGMLALIRHSGLLDDIEMHGDEKTYHVTMTRKGGKPHTEVFSMDDARKMMTTEYVNGQKQTIPLADKYNWKQMPKTMLKWRAVSACARVVFPDIIAGMYLPEEMGAEVDEDGNIVKDVTPPEPPRSNPPPPPMDRTPEEADPFAGDIVEQRKAEIVEAITAFENKTTQVGNQQVDQSTGEILSQYEYGNYVLGMPKVKTITGKDKATLDELYMTDEGRKYMEWIAGDTFKVKDDRSKDTHEAVQCYLIARETEKGKMEVSNDSQDLIAKAEAVKAKNAMPADAASAIDAIQQHIKSYVGTVPDDRLKKMRGLLAGTLDRIAIAPKQLDAQNKPLSEELRHLFLRRLFGNESVESLNAAQTGGLLNWIALARQEAGVDASTGKMRYIYVDTAQTKCAADAFNMIVRETQVANGQTEMAFAK